MLSCFFFSENFCQIVPLITVTSPKVEMWLDFGPEWVMKAKSLRLKKKKKSTNDDGKNSPLKQDVFL